MVQDRPAAFCECIPATHHAAPYCGLKLLEPRMYVAGTFGVRVILDLVVLEFGGRSSFAQSNREKPKIAIKSPAHHSDTARV